MKKKNSLFRFKAVLSMVNVMTAGNVALHLKTMLKTQKNDVYDDV
jgi:hypothetical protein